MIYITGDTHNTIDMHNASAKQIRYYCELQNVEYADITTLIILGDFGLPWSDCDVDENGIHPENKEDKYLLDWYNEKPFNILSVQGNHDNYSMIEKLPEVEMFGDKVRKVSDNIFYLERGHFYNIEGLSFLVLGGAKSHDNKFRKENIDCWDMSYEEAVRKSEQIRKEMIYELSMGSQGDLCLEELYIIPCPKKFTNLPLQENPSALCVQRCL